MRTAVSCSVSTSILASSEHCDSKPLPESGTRLPRSILVALTRLCPCFLVHLVPGITCKPSALAQNRSIDLSKNDHQNISTAESMLQSRQTFQVKCGSTSLTITMLCLTLSWLWTAHAVKIHFKGTNPMNPNGVTGGRLEPVHDLGFEWPLESQTRMNLHFPCLCPTLVMRAINATTEDLLKKRQTAGDKQLGIFIIFHFASFPWTL